MDASQHKNTSSKFGKLSIAAPLVGVVLLVLLVTGAITNDEGIIILGALGAGLTPFLGVMFGIISLCKQEQNRKLAVIGLIICSTAIMWLLTHHLGPTHF